MKGAKKLVQTMQEEKLITISPHSFQRERSPVTLFWLLHSRDGAINIEEKT